mgnify:CR=1 FL=1
MQSAIWEGGGSFASSWTWAQLPGAWLVRHLLGSGSAVGHGAAHWRHHVPLRPDHDLAGTDLDVKMIVGGM